MPTPPVPLLFPEALKSRGLWNELGKTHGLTRKDFAWFSHSKLASQTLRSLENPPMFAERILLTIAGAAPVPLAGSFVLSATPDDNGFILYTPYADIKKFDSRDALTGRIEQQLRGVTEDDDLIAFLSLAQRKALTQATSVQVSFQTIAGDVFDDQISVVADNQRLNDQAMLEELTALPTLESLLDTLLNGLLQPSFPGLDQRQTRVNFYVSSATDQQSPPVSRWINSVSLSEAVLWHYRDQRWPAGQHVEFTHPNKSPASTDQQHWETAVTTASRKLIHLLTTHLARFWSAASADGASRRDFFARAIREKARAELLLKRESEIISPEQHRVLHTIIEPDASISRGPTLETIRLWEYQANYVELAGSVMISHASACLYTPTQGLQVLRDYQDLKDTLLSKFSSSGHEDELYGLLSLEERNRFIGFDRPQVTGEVINGSIFKTLFNAIINKQQENLEYVLQVLRYSDGNVDIHALFDKALDIRSMISEQLLTLEAQGRWSTRPVLSGTQQPSAVLADTASAAVKTFSDVESLIRAEFAAQSVTSLAQQRIYLENMKPRLAHALAVGIRGEARLRALGSTLRQADRAIVDTVFNPDQPYRNSRHALNGFRPDAYSLILACTGQTNTLPLANCVLLTERGGLDTEHSGRAILWTPAEGLEVFRTVSHAKLELNRRLLAPRKRVSLLENLSPAQRQFHQRYSLGSLRLIDGNVLQQLSQTAIEQFLAASEHLRLQSLTPSQRNASLKKMALTVIDTNLRRATSLARAITRQHSLPAWLGMAPTQEQQLHIELLNQYCNSVTDDQDYLHGLQTLKAYVHERLVSLLGTRFPGATPDPDDIEITPNLALAGPSRTLSEFALNHVNIAQGTGLTISSTTTRRLPDGLDQNAVRQLLLSLDIQQTFGKKMRDSFSETNAEAAIRKLRFIRQLPWQLLQHAHALKLQQRLSSPAFNLIQQVLDMPDAIARAAIKDAHAIVRPLELIKTASAAAIKTLSLYLIGPGAGHDGPQVLYAPYSDAVFSEFDNEASLISAISASGPLQDLLIRRLPEDQQSLFSNLFKASAGTSSDITLASSPISGNLLIQLFQDNLPLLSRMLGSQSQITGQSEWEAVKNLFSSGIKPIAGMLPGKLAYAQFLWQSYKDFKDSAEALQDHHWKRALQSFISGAVQMLSLGRLSLESSIGTTQAAEETAPVATPVVDPQWSDIKPTMPTRTAVQPFEAPTVALSDLIKVRGNGTYYEPTSRQRFAPIAGKVYRVADRGPAWRMVDAERDGPALLKTPAGQLVLDPDRHTVHYGKALSRMHNVYASNREINQVLNIEARGMEEIRALHPEKARMIVQAIDMARYYAFNSLHNLVQARHLLPGTRLDTFLKRFFDVGSVDTSLLDKIRLAIVPICNALVDPDEDLMNSERFVVGSTKNEHDNLIAFVVDNDPRRYVHFTERFFDQQLDWYKSCLTHPFSVDGHSQAATLIHEFTHLISGTVDIASLEARRPFSDLITPITRYGATLKHNQEVYQREALSLQTPREELFARWSEDLGAWIDLDSIPGASHVGREILKIVGCQTMSEARAAFLDRVNAEKRIATILRNADSIAYLICEMGRQLDPVPVGSRQ